MVASPTLATIQNPFTGHIPEPIADVGALTVVAKAMKQNLEILTGDRGSAPGNRAVLFSDLVAFGILSPQAFSSLVPTTSSGATGTAGGDLSGTYPNPVVAKINTVALGSTTATSGNLLIGSGTQWVSHAITGDWTITNAGAATVAKINGATLGTTTATSGNLLIGSGTQWVTNAITGDMTITSGGVTTVAKINGVALGSTTATAGNLLIGSGTQWVTEPVSGDATMASTGALTLANTTVTGASYGDSTHVATFTVDGKGRLTAAASVAIAGSSGSIKQIVNTETGAVATGTTTVPLDDTIPQITEGDQYMSLAITPSNASSTLLIDIWMSVNPSVATFVVGALFQDATANALAAMWTYLDTPGSSTQLTFRHKMTAGTTSATTFKVRAGISGAAGTLTFNGSAGGRFFGGVLASSITITEVLP